MARSRESALKHSQSLSRGVDLDHCPVGNGFDNIFIEAREHRDASTTNRTGLASCRLEDTHPPGVTTTIGTMTIFPVRLC
jgi:hypothetical protein